MSILAEDTCDVPDNAIWMVTLTDHRWHTQRGLHVGDSLARLRHLYPKAHHDPDVWYIDERPEVVFMRAQIEHGRVDMIYLFADCKDPKCSYGL